MDYNAALHYAANVLSLTEKTKMFTGELLEVGENDVQSIRLNCFDHAKKKKHEVIVSQNGNYLMLVLQKEHEEHPEEEEEGEEGKEGEEAK